MRFNTWLEKNKSNPLRQKELDLFVDTEVKKAIPLILESSIPTLYMDKNMADLNITNYNGEEVPMREDEKTFSAMENSPVIAHNLEKKISAISSIFRSKINWSILCVDDKIKALIEKSLERILPKMTSEILYSMLTRGTSFQELMWEKSSLYHLGIGTEKDENYIVPSKPLSLNPTSIKSILRDKKTSSYIALKQYTASYPYEIIIPADKTLIVSNNGRYGKMFGRSILPSLYQLWFWHEVSFRSMNRYMEDMGKPKFVVRYPANYSIKDPTTNESIPVMKHAISIANTIASSQSVTIPSTKAETGELLFDISILSDTSSKQQNFIDVLNLLESKIANAINIYPDKEDTSTHDESLVSVIVDSINRYLIPRIIEYNFGLNSPRAYLHMTAINSKDKEYLFNILSIAGNSATVQKFYEVVDWSTLAKLSKIPVLEGAEAEKAKAEAAKAAEQASPQPVQNNTMPPSNNTQNNKKSVDTKVNNNLADKTKIKK